MEGDRIVAANLIEVLQRRATPQIVLRMNLEPGDGRASGDDLLDVRRAQPDAGPRRRASCVCIASDHPATHPPIAWHPSPLRLLGLQAAVHELLAGALGDVHPGVALLVPLGRAGAGRIGRLAVVLGCPHDAEALFVLELRHRRRAGLRAGEERHGECGGDGGCDEHTGRLHLLCPPGHGGGWKCPFADASTRFSNTDRRPIIPEHPTESSAWRLPLWGNRPPEFICCPPAAPRPWARDVYRNEWTGLTEPRSCRGRSPASTISGGCGRTRGFTSTRGWPRWRALIGWQIPSDRPAADRARWCPRPRCDRRAS